MHFVFTIAVAAFAFNVVLCTRCQVESQHLDVIESVKGDLQNKVEVVKSGNKLEPQHLAVVESVKGDLQNKVEVVKSDNELEPQHLAVDASDKGDLQNELEVVERDNDTFVGNPYAGDPSKPNPYANGDNGASDKLYDFEIGGKCCSKKDRWGNDIIRWFYKIPWYRGANGKPQVVSSCPSGWGKKTGYCPGKQAFNLIGKWPYEENTDWVYCCKQTTKESYTYFRTDYCEEEKALSSCKNYECQAFYDTDARKVKCAKGFSKWTNYKSTYHCKSRPPPHLGITDADCAGFTSECPKKQCMFQSKQTNSTDCTESCELAQIGNGTQGWTSKTRPRRNGRNAAGNLAVNYAVVLLSILSMTTFLSI